MTVLQCKAGTYHCGTYCAAGLKQECLPVSGCNPPPNLPASLKYDGCCEHLDTCT